MGLESRLFVFPGPTLASYMHTHGRRGVWVEEKKNKKQELVSELVAMIAKGLVAPHRLALPGPFCFVRTHL